MYTERNRRSLNIYYHNKLLRKEIVEWILSHPNFKPICVSSDIVKVLYSNYTLQFSHKLGKYFIKDGGLVCDAVYFNSLANFKKWYTSNEK